jgi:hypothetical protein
MFSARHVWELDGKDHLDVVEWIVCIRDGKKLPVQ